MIKLVFCLHRLPHLSREAFQRYWLDTHGPLVRELAPALGAKRYTQVHTMTSAFSEAMRRHRGAPEDFDGVAELWWETVEDFARAGATPRALADLVRRGAHAGRPGPLAAPRSSTAGSRGPSASR